ncbi:hypothetical protein H6G02_18005 [Leptolyngbya sp. FACHB-16]|nr:hypothetical protein [Leptolyngbya sp. FACHB-16]
MQNREGKKRSERIGASAIGLDGDLITPALPVQRDRLNAFLDLLLINFLKDRIVVVGRVETVEKDRGSIKNACSSLIGPVENLWKT